MKFKIIDCVGCDGFSDANYPKCREACPSDPPLFPMEEDLDLVVFKNKTFTKIHYLKEDEYVVSPFFVDVVLSPFHGKTIKKYLLALCGMESNRS